MRTFGFAPHILCTGFDRHPTFTPAAAGYPYPAGTVAYYHQHEPCINPTIYPDLHSTMDIRGYMARYDGSLGTLSTPMYHCSCNLHRQHALSSHPSVTLPPQLSPLSYDSKVLAPGAREEALGEEQRISSIVTLRTKAKEYGLNNLKIKSEFDDRERHSHVV